MTIAVRDLRARREAAGISLGEIARQTKFAVQTVQRAFATGDVSDPTLAKIAAVLDKALAKKREQLDRVAALNTPNAA